MTGVSARSSELRERAAFYTDELSKHPVLSRHWGDLSVVLKGSTARGNADRYSDVDFVVFCDKDVLLQIASEYVGLGLTPRTDGVFLPLGEWEGHYNLATYEALAAYFSGRNFPQAWEYSNTLAMHDPAGVFRAVVAEGMRGLFADHLGILRGQYLHLQLMLDWLRHPLKRADAMSALLHCAELLRSLAQMCYLLDARPYPHDKWLFHYLPATQFGAGHAEELMAFAAVAWPMGGLSPHLDAIEYPQHRAAEALIAQVVEHIRAGHGELPWLGDWYLYV